MSRFKKILIANRGEIAVRIIKTCQQLAIATVVAYTHPDHETVAVRMANESICIGVPENYLSIELLIDAAKKLNCDAIHPGFGFLAENAAFSRACQDAGIVFIGPSESAIRVMGSKSEAKAFLTDPANGLKVPMIPGYNGTDQDEHVFVREANKIGYPVLLKASAGGGGKGMRIVWKAEEMPAAVQGAKREARDFFADPKLLLEKYFPSVRHIEIQIMADNHGHVTHLFERDCSVQRRHQKIIEETPSPALQRGRLSQELVERIGQTAVAIGEAINYSNAGTVEFIMDEHENFYFLEVNTRLQVEHPITEETVGLDLVEIQIRIAEGETLAALGLGKGQIKRAGHAMECRLYAEDPANHFLPAPGKILYWQPALMEGVRFDSGVESGSEISIFFDPMIAKIIARGATREECLRRMERTLRQTVIFGLTTNQNFLLSVLRDKDFFEGNFNTHFIQNHPSIFASCDNEVTDSLYSILATLFIWLINKGNQVLHRHIPTGFNTVLSRKEYKTFDIRSKRFQVYYVPQTAKFSTNKSDKVETTFAINLNEKSYIATLHQHDIKRNDLLDSYFATLAVSVDGVRRIYSLFYDVGASVVWVHSEQFGTGSMKVIPKLIMPVPEDESLSNFYRSPMTGKIVSIHVKSGDAVVAGDVLFIIESMKMETKVVALRDGVVDEVFSSPQALVEDDQKIVSLK